MNIASYVYLFSTRFYVFYSLFPREGQIHSTIQRIRSLFFLILVKGIANAVVGRLAEKKLSFIDRISDFRVFTFQISVVLPYLVHPTDIPLSNFIKGLAYQNSLGKAIHSIAWSMLLKTNLTTLPVLTYLCQ